MKQRFLQFKWVSDQQQFTIAKVYRLLVLYFLQIVMVHQQYTCKVDNALKHFRKREKFRSVSLIGIKKSTYYYNWDATIEINQNMISEYFRMRYFCYQPMLYMYIMNGIK